MSIIYAHSASFAGQSILIQCSDMRADLIARLPKCDYTSQESVTARVEAIRAINRMDYRELRAAIKGQGV